MIFSRKLLKVCLQYIIQRFVQNDVTVPVLPLYFRDPHVVLSPVHQNDKLVLVPPLLERIPLPSDTTYGLVLKIITSNLSYSIP